MCTLRSGARRGGRVGVALPILTFLRARLRLSGTRRGGRPASRAPSHGRPSDDAAQGLVASLACTVCYRRCMASCVRACAGTAGRPLPAWRAPAARPADSVCRLRAGRWRCASARTRLGKLGYVYIPYVYPTLASAVCVQGAGAAAPPGQGGGERPRRGGRQRAALPRGLPRARVPVRPRPAPHVRAARSLLRGGDAPLPCVSTLGTLHTLRMLEASCSAQCRQSHPWLPVTAGLQQPPGLALAQPRATLAACPFGPAAGPAARLPPSLPAKGERWAPTQLACSAQRMRCADAAARAGTTWPACGDACGQRQRRPPCTPSDAVPVEAKL